MLAPIAGWRGRVLHNLWEPSGDSVAGGMRATLFKRQWGVNSGCTAEASTGDELFEPRGS